MVATITTTATIIIILCQMTNEFDTILTKKINVIIVIIILITIAMTMTMYNG